ncbi:MULTISPECIES: class I SAM-dependent methyltransferase [unclassified Nocardiopsis]|uniref:class I SAM-dependent methyltransferase n=1 Tax=unclassified Nocardiopsis TaxID=2649073 RepID=UPI0019166168|nr:MULTISPECIES: methyltransferase domain-containing protein [unclassified Nocardiopsis]
MSVHNPPLRDTAWRGWQLGGSTAQAYERFLVPAVFAPWGRELVRLADPAPDARVLDVACGTGVLARIAAERLNPDARVTGVDINPDMIAVARAVAPERAEPIRFTVGDACALDLPGGEFDTVLCQQALQFLADREAALAEMRRVLVPGGRLALSVLRPLRYNPAYGAFAEALARHVGPDAGAMMRAPFPELDTDDLRGLLRGAGFDPVTVRISVTSARYPSVRELVRQETLSSPLAARIQEVDEAARADLVAETGRLLADHTDDEGVVLPVQTHLALAERPLMG